MMEYYEVLEAISTGSFGSAFLVRHKHDWKRVLIALSIILLIAGYMLKKIYISRQTDKTLRFVQQEGSYVCKRLLTMKEKTWRMQSEERMAFIFQKRSFANGLSSC
ncbi:OLC1v1009155C1 [Oldenlandia corymbosa var. corymbosa]|uniref:OLC1v1009155C1 n=1 Tax=Oldenlandia corymbosa var. corymbosa TaxID=529605 RepID=A0AAV1DR45_OLDCO|nr:OLC1v1009155C1 [Oldenlandia corymbosa var. corymbosa]